MKKVEINSEKGGASKIAGGRRWRVLQANTNAERLAASAVRALGFEVYLPMAITERPRTERRPAAKLVRPFLPGYLFARVDALADDWGALYSTIGIKAIMRSGDQPLALPDEIVARIKAREELGLIKLPAPTADARWSRGDAVKVSFPTYDIDAVFEELLDTNRAAVFVSLLGRVTRQEVDLLLLK